MNQIPPNFFLFLYISIQDRFKKILIPSMNFLSLQHSSPDIICLSETRLEQPLININIPDYSFMNNDSPTNAGGVATNISIV